LVDFHLVRIDERIDTPISSAVSSPMLRRV
jgi:hypothetical protein